MKNRCEWCNGARPRTARFMVSNRENERASTRFACGNHLGTAVNVVTAGRAEMTCVFYLPREQ